MSDPALEARIDELLARLTWDEKLAQLQIVFRPRFEDAAALARAGTGSLFWPGTTERTNELQRVAIEESAHGIPLLIGLDVIHGQFTIFPDPLAQAASFDPDVALLDAQVSAAEATSGGVNWTFSPMVDISRDPRWGRIVEGFGEDPFLVSAFGAAKVRGYQGDSLASPTSMLACAKHYVAYGLAEGGRDYNTVDASEYSLRNTYLEPFKATVEAGVATVMASFNTVAGRPAHSNRHLLTEILKDEWAHLGLVVGDADGVIQLVTHGVAVDERDAVAQSLRAGLDIEMGGHVIDANGAAVVDQSDVSVERVDDAVRRVLRLKFALGLFDSPYQPVTGEITAATRQTRAQARWAATRCPVLLKNDGSLPLGTTTPRLLVVGPYADSTDHLGAWTQSWAAPARSVTEALRDALPETEITALPGAKFFGIDPELQTAAAAAAASADFVVVAVGEPSSLSGEASSRSDIGLTGDQAALIRAIAATGIPFAVVLVNGRTLTMGEWIDHAPAVLQTWHLGSEGPDAIADLLTGRVNPGGKLPASIPRSSSQIPYYYNHENTGRPPSIRGHLEHEEIDVAVLGPGNTDDYYTSKYLDSELGPQFEFGHGLSYTTFEISAPELSAPTVTLAELEAGATMTVAVTVSNTGPVAGDEVVQLYVRDLVASIAQPVRRLRGFSRLTLEPGSSAVVEFSLSHADLGFWDDSLPSRFVVEAGEFEVHVGGSLQTTQSAQLTVAPD